MNKSVICSTVSLLGRKQHNKYGLLTKRQVKMARYWSINTQKKRTRPISSHLDRASLVNKGFIIWDKTPKHDLCTCGTKPVSRAGKIAPSQREIRFILPAHGARQIIMEINYLTMWLQ